MDSFTMTAIMIVSFVLGVMLAAFSLIARYYFVPNTFEYYRTKTEKYKGREAELEKDLKKMKQRWLIPLAVGVVLCLPLLYDLVTTPTGPAGYSCDICGKTVTSPLSAGGYDLCGSCYNSFK